MKCKSLVEYIDIIKGSQCYLNSVIIGKLYYRGQANKKYKLIPSLCHVLQGYDTENYIYYEKEIVEMAQMKYPELFCFYENRADLLALIQHYGLPTRMMDITENPLVALYFACLGEDEKDGEVIVFGADIVYTCYDIVPNIISSFYLDTHLQNQVKVNHIVKKYMNEHISYGREELHETLKRIIKPCFLETKTMSERQRMQQGHFVLFPNKILNKKIVAEILPIEKDSEIVKERITIPAKYKVKILQELSLFGITKSKLFPENKDDACKEMLQYIVKDAYQI